MSTRRVVLECPFCEEIIEFESPDRLHSAYSMKKAIVASYHSDLVKKKRRCQNPECKKTIEIYWYAPLDNLIRT